MPCTARFFSSHRSSQSRRLYLLGAEFIAGVQILVYIGGVMVLFLFVIMLVNVGAEERGRERIFNNGPQVWTSVILALLLAAGLVYALRKGWEGLHGRDQNALRVASARRVADQQNLPVAATGTSRITKETERASSSLYRYASLPFEIASVLLRRDHRLRHARATVARGSRDDVDPEVMKAEMTDDG